MSPFLVIPALDLSRGRLGATSGRSPAPLPEARAVKLHAAKPGTGRDYGEPLRWLREWESAAPELVMVFDLDAHFGTGENRDLLGRLVSALGPRTSALVGGGIATREAAARWLDSDPRVRVLLLDPASRDPDLVRSVAGTYGRHRLYLGVNHRGGSDIRETIERANALGPSAAGVIVTDLSRDATGAGLDMDLFRTLAREIRVPLIAAGGLAWKEEIRELKAVGAAGVVVGKATFDRRYTLRELIHEGGR